MTIAEFSQVPDIDHLLELREGQPFRTEPLPYGLLRSRTALLDHIEKLVGPEWLAAGRVGYLPTPEYNLWASDVVVLHRRRWAEDQADDWIHGAPNLVVEFELNRRSADLTQRMRVCFSGGCQQFWTVSPECQSVKVTSADGRTAAYHAGDEIDLAEFGSGKIPVSEIFPK